MPDVILLDPDSNAVLITDGNLVAIDPACCCGGACCYPDGTCDNNLSETDCTDAHGDWQGPNSHCEDQDQNSLCPPIGACCHPDGTCDNTSEDECDDGDWQGQGTDCDVDVCPPVGACCHPDGSCDITDEEECDDGEWQGQGSYCEDPDHNSLCPPEGACCRLDNTCDISSEENCDDGEWQGQGVTCDPNPCTTGACCNQGGCSEETEDDCLLSGGVFMGNGTHCSEPGICPFNPCRCNAFQAFDGSYRHFETLTRTSNGSEQRQFTSGTHHWTINTQQSSIRTHSCFTGCACSGGNSVATCDDGGSGDCALFAPLLCTGSTTSCVSGTWSGCNWSVSPPNCSGSPQECDTPCFPIAPYVTVSATLRTQNDSCDIGLSHYDHSASEILTVECWL